MISTGNRCKATNQRGEPCAAYSGANSDFCFWHDPARVQDRAKARRSGGQSRHGRKIGVTGDNAKVSVKTMQDVVGLLEQAVNDALSLENSLQRARTVGSLASVIIRALEFATLEERVVALEAALREREK